MMAGAMGYTIWGWSRGLFTTGDVVLVNTLLSQLFRPLDMLGLVYRNIRPCLIDMQAMFAPIATPADLVAAPDAPPLQIDPGDDRKTTRLTPSHQSAPLLPSSPRNKTQPHSHSP